MSAGTSESALMLLNFASRYRTASGPGSQAGNLLGVVDATALCLMLTSSTIKGPVATARGSVTYGELPVLIAPYLKSARRYELRASNQLNS